MIRWQRHYRRPLTPSAQRHWRVAWVVCAGVSALGIATILERAVPLIVYNSSPSAPIGFYRVEPVESLVKGDLVLMDTPETVRALADQRQYLPSSVPMIKHIAALTGDEVCAKDDVITINDRVIVWRLQRDHLGRPMPQWQGCIRLQQDQMLALNPDARLSFDGRYFGVASTKLVIGKLVKL